MCFYQVNLMSEMLVSPPEHRSRRRRCRWQSHPHSLESGEEAKDEEEERKDEEEEMDQLYTRYRELIRADPNKLKV